MWGRARTGATIAAALAAGLATVAHGGAIRPAGAHPADPGMRVVLDEVAPPVPGVTIAVAVSAAPQLVASNTTATELVVPAETGEPFLRIGPAGVLANLDSPAWYLSNSPGGAAAVPDTARPDAPPRWVQVAVEPAWGWFDHRLHPEPARLPPDVLERSEPATLARWEVPFDYGGTPVTASGRIEYRPERGRVSARLVGGHDPLPGVSVQLAPGPVPGLVLHNTGAEAVTVLGPAGEPFARVGPAGVEVNRHSPLWVDNARAQDRDPAAIAVVDPAAEPDWLAVSPAPTFAWLEFRGAYPDTDPPRSAARAPEPTVLAEWSVPLAAGGQSAAVRGETLWVPGETPGASAPGPDPGANLRRPATAVVVIAGALALVVVWVRHRVGAARRRRP